jgi:F1F0 ATPase subunit 2
MDAERMNLGALEGMPAWVMLADLAAHLVGGIVLGVLYFRGLWWNARLFAMAGHVSASIGLMIGRIVLLGGLLVLASLEGALPLLVMTLGVLVGRFMVMRRAREAAP